MEWDDESRAQVLALLEHEAGSCNGCGGWLPETTAKENQHKYRTEDPVRCHRCTALHYKRAQYTEPDHQAMVLWPVDLA